MSGGSPNQQKPWDAQEPLENGSGTEANRRGKWILGAGTDLRGKWRWAAAAHQWRSLDLPCPRHINFYPQNGSKTEAERKLPRSRHQTSVKLDFHDMHFYLHNGSKTEANKKS